MSGVRYYNFREGDRSEYFANFILSGIGLTTPIPRQEDIGFDFYCLLADNERGNLTFGYPFLIQIKSKGLQKIEYGWDSKNKRHKPEEIRMLFKQELPIFIGLVDKDELSIDIYSTSTLNFIYRECPNASKLTLHPRLKYSEKPIERPSPEEISDWVEDSEFDGKNYNIDIGNALISFSNNDLREDGELKISQLKILIRKVIINEQQNLVYRKLNLPYFQWVRKTITNQDASFAWIYYHPDKIATEMICDATINNLISIYLGSRNQDNMKELNSITKRQLELIGLEKLPKEIRNIVNE